MTRKLNEALRAAEIIREDESVFTVCRADTGEIIREIVAVDKYDAINAVSRATGWASSFLTTGFKGVRYEDCEA